MATVIEISTNHCVADKAPSSFDLSPEWTTELISHKFPIMSTICVETFLYFAWVIYGARRIQGIEATKQEYNDFRSTFGTEPLICVEIWNLIEPEDNIHSDAMPYHLLWSLYYLCCYPKQKQLALFLRIDVKTARVWIWRFLPRIAELAVDLIAWEDRYIGNSPLKGINVVIDCTCCPLLEPRKPFSSGWSAHKFGKKAGVNYEVAQSLATGMVVWTNGPYPAGDFPDKSIFDRELILMLDEGETVLADAGYTGRDTYITSSNMYEQDPIKKAAKARLEQLNGRFKSYDVLSQKFREERSRHYDVFHAVAVIVQLEIKLGVYCPFNLEGR